MSSLRRCLIPLRAAALAGLLLAVALLLTLLVLAAPAHAQAPPVSVTLEPRQIAVGETAQLTITTTGNGMDALTLPQVAGLEFRVVGQSRRVEIINGATLSTFSVVVRITPQQAGIFTIPGIGRSQPLVLRVNPDTGGSTSPYGGPPRQLGAAPRAPVLPGGATLNGIHLAADGAAYIRMNLPKRPVYVGESIPVDIEVGLRGGYVTSLNGLPTLSGNDFTLNNLSRKPERVEKLIDGQPFIILTWHSVLAPVKPGEFPLSVSSPLTIRVRTRQKDATIDDLLGDPFMQNFFGATVQKDVTIASPSEPLTVLALPTEGQPADFSGAVGSFKIATDLSGSAAAVGDPLTLKLHVTGTGNFDRVDTPMIEHLDRWKTYPPKSNFTAGDAVGVKGEKTFEQPLIASQPGPQTLPPLSFSYFDPGTRRYETAHSAPLSVAISPSLENKTPEAATANGATQAGQTPGATPPDATPDGLRPDHPPGATVSSLRPLYLRPGFLALPSLLAAALAGGWFALRRQAQSRAPGRRQRTVPKSAVRVLAEMQSAADARDPAAFFNAVRAGLEARDARDAATIATEPESATARLLALADEAQYSGRDLRATDFEHWLGIVREHLTEEVPA